MQFLIGHAALQVKKGTLLENSINNMKIHRPGLPTVTPDLPPSEIQKNHGNSASPKIRLLFSGYNMDMGA